MDNTRLTNIQMVGWLLEMEEDDHTYTSHGQMNNTQVLYNTNEIAEDIIINSDHNLQKASSSESYTSNPYNTIHKRSNSFEICQTGFERPIKKIKPETLNLGTETQTLAKTSSKGFEISFGDSKYSQIKSLVASDELVNFYNYDKQFDASKSRPPSRDQEHVIAERRRREKLNQQFIDLAVIVPGLKKMDKASVLGEAVKYLKKLQERVNLLEEKTKRKFKERVIFLNKSRPSDDNGDTSSCDKNSNSQFEEADPQIEAIILDKNVLIRIHCENQKGLATKLLDAIESFHLTISHSSFLPFGKYKMDITIIGQMGAGFNIVVKDLVRNLHEAFALSPPNKFESPEYTSIL